MSDRKLADLLRGCLKAVEDLHDIGRDEFSVEPSPEDLDLTIEIKRTIAALESRTPTAPGPARLA